MTNRTKRTNRTNRTNRTVLTLGKSLHHKAALVAQWEGVSLEEYVLEVIAEAVGRQAGQQRVISITTANAPTVYW